MIISLDNIFRFLNFLVVCIGAVYLMRRYGILYIITSMRLQKQKQEELDQEYHNLLQECDAIKQQSQEQEVVYAAMQKKFHVWQEKVKQDDIVKQSVSTQYRQLFEQKQLVKMHNLQQQQIIKQQMPLILKEVSDSLQLKFEQNSEHRKNYTAQLVKFVTEREL